MRQIPRSRDVGNVRARNMRSVPTTRTGPATVWREDQRLCCAVGFGAQNTTFCTAGQRPHADLQSAQNGGYRVSRDRQAVTVCNEMPVPELASQVSRGPVPADRSRHGERHHGIVIIGRGLRSSLSP